MKIASEKSNGIFKYWSKKLWFSSGLSNSNSAEAGDDLKIKFIN